MFLHLLAQVDPSGLIRVLDQIDVKVAKLGWRNAPRGREPGANAQQVTSLLIHHAFDRNDAVGELARQLRRDFPSQSITLEKTLERIDLSGVIDSVR